jgi:protoporphyrinogen/coproporphyrinogen III oxidase
MPRVLIIGGGISGLTLAYRLEKALPTAEVVVVEQAERVGGTIGTLERDGFVVEMGPNGFLDNKPNAFELCRELGLADRLIPASEAARRNRFLLLDGRLRKLPTGPFSFLGSTLFSCRAKWNLLTERFRRPRKSDEDESIEAFAVRRIGRELADTLGDAFVTGIYAGDPTLLSIQATFPRLAAFEREHGSVFRGMAAARRHSPTHRPQMWSFREGLRVLTGALRDALRTAPHTSTEVKRVRREVDGWRVEGDILAPPSLFRGGGLGGRGCLAAFEEPLPLTPSPKERGGTDPSSPEGRRDKNGSAADAIALMCPAWRQAELLADVDADLAAQVRDIPYNRVAVVALGFRSANVAHKLDGFGYLSPQRNRRDVLGVQWCSSIFPDRAPGGHVLMRAMCGGWNRPEIVDWPEERLVSRVIAELRDVLGVRGEPVFHEVVRWHRAIPQYHVGHLERVAKIEERTRLHPGLFLGGNAYRGVAMNDCIEQAGRMAEVIAVYLSGQK